MIKFQSQDKTKEQNGILSLNVCCNYEKSRKNYQTYYDSYLLFYGEYVFLGKKLQRKEEIEKETFIIACE